MRSGVAVALLALLFSGRTTSSSRQTCGVVPGGCDTGADATNATSNDAADDDEGRLKRLLASVRAGVSLDRGLLSRLEEAVGRELGVPSATNQYDAPASKTTGELPAAADYCVVGAGLAGLQMGRFLQAAGRDYVILERGRIAEFFRTFPRHRR